MFLICTKSFPQVDDTCSGKRWYGIFDKENVFCILEEELSHKSEVSTDWDYLLESNDSYTQGLLGDQETISTDQNDIGDAKTLYLVFVIGFPTSLSEKNIQERMGK